MIIPLVLILIQLNLWFGYQSLASGQEAVLKVKLKKDLSLLDAKIMIKTNSGLEVETPPLRIEESSEVNWRLRAKEAGIHDLKLILNGEEFVKKVAVALKPLSKISPIKIHRNFFAGLFNPGEPPISENLPVSSVEINYPSKHMNLSGWRIHWIIVYFALSIIFGFSFKGLFRVEI